MEVEGPGSDRLASLLRFSANPPGQLRGGFQSEVRTAFGRYFQKGRGIFFVLEGTDEVVGIPDEVGLPAHVAAAISLEPEDERVVQVDVGEYGGDVAVEVCVVPCFSMLDVTAPGQPLLCWLCWLCWWVVVVYVMVKSAACTVRVPGKEMHELDFFAWNHTRSVPPSIMNISLKSVCVLIFTAAALLLVRTGAALADDEAKPAKAKAEAPSAPAAAEASPAVSEDMEAAFAILLRDKVFQGRWCSVADDKMGPDKDEKYTIISVAKSGGDRWMVNTKIEYDGRSFVFPVPVQVKWAGDTPVIVVDKLVAPGGTYSARVMIFEKSYSGTWTAGDHGGLLHGLILPAKEEAGK